MSAHRWAMGVVVPNALGLLVLAAVILPVGDQLGIGRLAVGFAAEALAAVGLSWLANRKRGERR